MKEGIKLWMVFIFILCLGCKHTCPKCSKTIIKEIEIKVPVIRIQTEYIVVSDDKELQVALQMYRECLILIGSGSTQQITLYDEYGKEYKPWTYARKVLSDVRQSVLKDK